MNLIPWRHKEREEESQRSGGELMPPAFRSELDRLFDRFFGGSDWEDSGWGSVDVSEDDREVTVQADLPGMDPKDIDISVAGNLLTVSAEKRQESEKKGRNYYRSQRRTGAFRRSMHLPAYVKADQVDAEYRNGVLTLHLPKDESARGKRVPVRTDGG